jgi:hypothetical protein
MRQDNTLNLTELNDIISLAGINRGMLENLKSINTYLGVCCNPILAELEHDQYLTEYYLAQMKEQQHRIDLGFPIIAPAVIWGITALTSLGTWVWYQYNKLKVEQTKADAELAKANCAQNALDQGYDPASVTGLCNVEGETKESLTQTIQTYLGYAMILGVVYVTIKIIK